MRAFQRVISAAAVTLLALPVAAQSESHMSKEMRNEIRKLIREEVRAAVKDALADSKGTKTSVAKKIAAKKNAFAKKAAAAKKHTVALKKAMGAKGNWNSALKDALKVLKNDDGELRVINLDGAIDLGGNHAWMGEGDGVQVILDAIAESEVDDEGHETHRVFVVGDGEHGEWTSEGHEHAEKVIAKLHGNRAKWFAKGDDDDDHGSWIAKAHAGGGKKFELPNGKGWVTLKKDGDSGNVFQWVTGDDDDHKTIKINKSFKVMSGDEGNVFFLRKGEGHDDDHDHHHGHDADHGHEEECTRHETFTFSSGADAGGLLKLMKGDGGSFTFDGGEGQIIVRRSGDNEDVDVKVIRSDDFHKAHGKGMVLKLDDVTNECCEEGEANECCEGGEAKECCEEGDAPKFEKGKSSTIHVPEGISWTYKGSGTNKKKSKKSILL